MNSSTIKALILISTLLGSAPSWAQTADPSAQASTDLEEPSYIVKFKSPTTMHAAMRGSIQSATTAKGQKIEVITDQMIRVSGKNASNATVLRNQNVEYVQPDYKISLIEDYALETEEQRAQAIEYFLSAPQLFGNKKAGSDNPLIPLAPPPRTARDPLINKQWGMIDIGATQVWPKAQNNKNIIVAVIDSGVDYTHPDLLPNMWRNPGETGLDSSGKDKTKNGIDDDRNGYVDDVVGYDFATNDSLPYDKATPTWQLLVGAGNPGHGTHCAGNVAARGNNGVGISGVAPYAQIMALRFITEKGQGVTSSAVKAIRYAVDNGAKILNNSWGAMGENPKEGVENHALREAIKYAESKGVLFVAAAGNGFRGKGYDNDSASKPSFPASYPYDNIISVAAIDAKDNLGKFSNYGAKTVHIGAPGVKIYSTVVGAKYSDQPIPYLAVWEGTSMAAPHVAGAAALYWSQYPHKTMAEVKEALLKSAVRIPSLQNKTVSGGKLNLINLMRYN
jgi:thermitase